MCRERRFGGIDERTLRSDAMPYFARCPHCGAVNDEHSARCYLCDASPLIVACPECGTAVRNPLHMACPACGTGYPFRNGSPDPIPGSAVVAAHTKGLPTRAG